MQGMNKQEWLQAIIRNTESLSEMSKLYPQIFKEVVNDVDLEKLERLTSNLAANVKQRVNGNDTVLLDGVDIDSSTTQ